MTKYYSINKKGFTTFSLHKRGFTLIELLIVIAVLGILAGAVFLAVNPGERFAQGRDAVKKTSVKDMSTTFQAYYVSNFEYPQGGTVESGIWADSSLGGTGGECPSDTYEANGYCYKVNDDQSEAIIYTPLESSLEQNDCAGGDAYFLWSSVDSQSGIYCSLSQPQDTDGGYAFGDSNNTLTQGLVGWWKMDSCSSNPVTDSSSNNINATRIGSVVTAAGKDGSACQLQGGYINTSSSVLSNLTSDFTVATWVYPQVINTGYSRIISADSYTIGQKWYIENNGGSPGKLTFRAGAGSVSNTTLVVNTWYHVAMVREGTSAKLYINGNLDKSASGGSINASSSIGIGADANGGSRLTGRIDDMRIYNRALSSTEIQALYESY